ncbi:MAG: sigE, partial [Myxococcales bacterium]|nr:sigE [Myxococcales bacterium]
DDARGGGAVSALGLYSLDVRAHPMMSPAEQQALACRFASRHDPRDAERLVLANLRLVISLATKLGGRHRPDLMDLVQEGNAGLMLAVERFDPGRGSRLSAYASIWIRAYILRHIMETSHVVRVTTRVGRLRFFARTLPRDVHLDAPTGPEGDAGGTRAPRLDFVRADERLRPDVIAEKHEDLRRLRSAVRRFAATMDTRERAILEERLLSDTPRPLRQLGAAIDLSGERVRQVEREMVARLRALIVEPPSDDARVAA